MTKSSTYSEDMIPSKREKPISLMGRRINRFLRTIHMVVLINP